MSLWWRSCGSKHPQVKIDDGDTYFVGSWPPDKVNIDMGVDWGSPGEYAMPCPGASLSRTDQGTLDVEYPASSDDVFAATCPQCHGAGLSLVSGKYESCSACSGSGTVPAKRLPADPAEDARQEMRKQVRQFIGAPNEEGLWTPGGSPVAGQIYSHSVTVMTHTIQAVDRATPAFEKLSAAFEQLANSIRSSTEQFARTIATFAFKPEVRRCDGCYLPMRYSFEADQHECNHCGYVVTGEQLYGRSRWQCWRDWLTGMEF